MKICTYPLISVIIPTYNHGHFIATALKSVLDQEYSNFEIIIVDNNSTDNTEQQILFFKDSRIRYYKIDNEGVIAKSRNLGILHSNGDWIAFLDSDDFWYSRKLSDFINLISQGNIADVFVHDEFLHFLTTGKKRRISCGPFTKNFYLDMLIYGNRVSTSAVMMKKDFLTSNKLLFNERKDFISVEDFDLWLKIAYYGGVFFFHNKPLGEYIIHDNNTSSNSLQNIQNLTSLLKYHVYHVQVSEEEKDILWKRVKVKIELMEFKYKIENQDYYNSLKDLKKIFSNIKYVYLFLMGKLRITLL